MSASAYPADRPLSDYPLVAFDTETTGLSPAQERVVELAAVREENGRREEFSFLLDPGKPIPPGAQRVHGISDAMVRGRPALERVLPDFIEFCAGAVLVAHNAPFDIGYLAVGLQRAGIAPPDNPVLDSLELSRALLAGPSNYKLETLVRYLRIPAAPAHRALGDAAMCLAVTRRVLEEKQLAAAPLSRVLALGRSRGAFTDHDPARIDWPPVLAGLREALPARAKVRVAWRDYGRDEGAEGAAAACFRDERGGVIWLLLATDAGERAIRLDAIRSVSPA